MFSNKENPFQIWCCNTELYEQGEEMGLNAGFPHSPRAVEYYEEQCKLYGGKVTFEFRHYGVDPKFPDSFEIL